jgi:hypothetical protein
MQVYLALLAAVTLCAAFLPLSDHLGYELAEVIALCAGLFGAAPGVAAARAELWRNDADALHAFGVALGGACAALALPLAIILLNGLRRPACDPGAGLVLYLALAVPSGLLAAALGVACESIAPHRAGWIVAAVFAATLAVALWPIYFGPQVFAFHHLGGMFPGPLYDEVIAPTRALWIFRAATLLYAGACGGVALIAGPGKRRRTGIALLLACGVPAVWLSLQAERFHWKASTSLIDERLGGTLRTRHLVLHFPREKSENERRLLAQDAEVSLRAVRAFAGLTAESQPAIEVFLYRSADEKRLLIGAAETSFTKPWLLQVHTNDAPAPHPILRHELAHAAFAELAPGPFGVPGGIVPQMALVEGAAVAADWPPGEFTIHEESRALRDLRLLPDVERLFQPARFYAESGPRAYTAAGSALRFLWQSQGPKGFREAYSHGISDRAALAREHSAFLDGLPVQPRATALSQQRFAAPAIVRRPCAREVAQLRREAEAAPPQLAARLWARCAQLEPDDPSLLVQLRRAQLKAGAEAAARETEDRALRHPKLSQPLFAAIVTETGDAFWRAGDAAGAREHFEKARRLVQPEPQERALSARLWALADDRRWPALRRLLADGDAGPETWLALKELADAEPREGLPPYLLAKQLQNRGSWADCARYAREALGRGVPGPRFDEEARRMLGIAAWHLGDTAAAREAFTQLGAGAPSGRADEAARWLDLLAP